MPNFSKDILVWAEVHPWNVLVGTGALQADPVVAKLDAFTRLPVGWDYGHGGPISQAIIDQAKTWYGSLRKCAFSYVNAFPSPDSVTLAAGIGDHRIEIIFKEQHGSIRFGFVRDFKRRREVYKPNLSAADLTTIVLESMSFMITGGAWNASISSTPINMTPMGGLLYQRHSRITAAASQWWESSVQTVNPGPYAPMPINTVPAGERSLVILPFFSEFHRQKPYIQTAA